MKLPVDEGDCLGLVQQVMRSMATSKLTGTLGEDIEEELKKLPWKTAVYVTEQLMYLGRRVLYDKCYVSLLQLIDEVNTKKDEIRRANTFEEEIAPTYQCGKYLIDLQGAIVSEIRTWHTYSDPPLEFLGKPVIYRTGPDFHFDPIPNIIEYGLADYPKTWSPILDSYLKGYHKAMMAADGKESRSKLEEYCLNFYNYLKEEIKKQINIRSQKKKEAPLAL